MKPYTPAPHPSATEGRSITPTKRTFELRPLGRRSQALRRRRLRAASTGAGCKRFVWPLPLASEQRCRCSSRSSLPCRYWHSEPESVSLKKAFGVRTRDITFDIIELVQLHTFTNCAFASSATGGHALIVADAPPWRCDGAILGPSPFLGRLKGKLKKKSVLERPNRVTNLSLIHI